ncbi:ucp10 [[Candida] subhashii]|uniref:Ucp10 n=1 Tax=[Candida] subhashii TaxID=561895 RepID=A0A8J5UMA5_9ASCO|nr:ucp10 [[Candida] subhashii]KAG7665973.1 ucp10 [[Candida] subhashii]
MSSIPIWLSRLLPTRQVRGGYQAVSNNSNDVPSSTLPGAYPVESVEPRNRNYFNSQTIQATLRKIPNWIIYFIIQPIIILVLILFRILGKVISLLFTTSSFTSTATTKQVIDPTDRAHRFIRDLEDNLPVTLNPMDALPPFFQGSYTQALYMATNRAKYLFIYLTNSRNEGSNQIFNKIIINREFVNLFQDPNMIIWGGDLTNPEAYQLANSLCVTKFPFLGLLCLTRTTTMSPTGPIKTPAKISLISRLQGGLKGDADANGLIDHKFKKKIAKYQDELILIRQELEDKFMSRLLVKQQELNYQASLEKDRAKKRQREFEKLTKEYLVYIAPKYRDLIHQRSDTAKIGIKCKDGTRHTVYFPKEMKIEDIFIYVELMNRGYLSESIISTLSEHEASEKFQNFKLTYKFQLSSPLPPRQSLIDKRDQFIMDVDLVYPSGLLLVEDI